MCRLVCIILGFDLFRRPIAQRLVEALRVPPRDPPERRQFQLGQVGEWLAPPHQLGLVLAVGGFGHGVVVRVADRAGRGKHAIFPDLGGVHRAGVLRPMVAVVHETVGAAMRCGPRYRLFQRLRRQLPGVHAKSIDAFAHQTALNDGGRTVAFIGTGIDRQCSTENRGLQQEIEKRGLVFSRFWPGLQPTKQSFPMRNALMSGYGVATIIADVGEHSGTRIQARQAQRHGRPIIINHMVLDKTQWARDLAGRPSVYVVDNVKGVERALDRIFLVNDNVDSLIKAVLAEEPAKV